MESIREKVAAGKKVAGLMIRISHTPDIAWLVKNAGLDFMLLDCEHSDFGSETIHNIAMMGKALGISTIVRVPELSEAWISRTLDNGAEGIMVPNLDTVEQAEQFVKFAKYTPIGARGFTQNGGHTCFKGGKHADVIETINSTTLCIAQIETRTAVQNADAIAAVEGIDALLIGPNDLSVSLGIPGDTSNPIELEAIGKVADAAHAHGKMFSIHSGAKLTDRFADKLSFVTQGTDLDMLNEGMKKVRAYADEKLPE